MEKKSFPEDLFCAECDIRDILFRSSHYHTNAVMAWSRIFHHDPGGDNVGGDHIDKLRARVYEIA